MLGNYAASVISLQIINFLYCHCEPPLSLPAREQQRRAGRSYIFMKPKFNLMTAKIF
jgi:hypothetical protein